MKQMNLLTAGICMLMPFMLLAQDPATKTTTPVSNYAFSKGKSSMELMRNFNYDNLQDFQGDQKEGHHNDLYFGLSYNYFFQKNIAVGIDLNANSTGTHYTSDIMKRDWLAKLNFTYGIPLSENIDLYGRLGIGIGKEKLIQESGSNSTTNSDDLFKYHLEFGLPIRLYENGNVYFTPKLSYSHLETSYDDGD